MIEIKARPCNGTGQAKGYGCGKITKHRIYGLGKMCCYTKWLLESDAGKVKMQKALNQAQKPRQELEKAAKEKKDTLSRGNALKNAQIAFNAYIRERDKFKPCISSNSPWQRGFEAGHFFTVKQYTALRFDEDNVHGQSIGDNRFKEGNNEDYSVNLVNRIGKERYDKLMERASLSKQTVKQWSLYELQEIRKEYINKLKQLRNGN